MNVLRSPWSKAVALDVPELEPQDSPPEESPVDLDVRPAPTGFELPPSIAGPWSPELLARLGRAYGLGDLAEWQSVAVLPRSRLQVTADGRTLLLRAVDRRANGALALKSELALVSYLAENHFPVAAPIKNRAGADFTSVRDFLFVLTEPANAVPYCNDDRQHRIAAGATLARMHDLLLEYSGPVAMGTTPWFTDAIDQRLDWIRRRAGTLSGAAPGPMTQRFSQELSDVSESARRVYEREVVEPVHGAYEGSALTYVREKTAEVANFDNVGQDLRVAEVARALFAFCVDPDEPGDPQPSLDAALDSDFLGAYQEFSPLSRVEREALPALLRAIYLIRLVDDCRGLLETSRRYAARSLLLEDGPRSHSRTQAPSGARDRRSAEWK